MHKTKFLLFSALYLFFTLIHTPMVNAQTYATLETTSGNIKIKLYDDTPLHRDNFIKLVNQGYYNGVLFHRVISGFMIQTGDPNSRNARPGQPLGDGGPNYTIPAEFSPEYFHKKGAIAAARLSDDVNPKKESSGSQFYIVQGKVYNLSQLESLEKSNRHTAFTEIQKESYTTTGGVPHLDNAYTVFGEVVEGLETIDSIASATTDQRNRPYTDIRIVKAYISE
jgi:cyclophilin family peptidyl-prolyl cis-trans isomerase